MRYRSLNYLALLTLCVALACAAQPALAVPLGYLKTTLATNAPPIGLAYSNAGVLYALEEPNFGDNSATIRVFQPNLTESAPLSITSNDPTNLFLGSMAYDPVGNALLITDNAANRLYSLNVGTNVKTSLATNIPFIQGVAVRSTGEVFVSTSDGFGAGKVLMIDRTTGTPTTVMTGLDYAGSLAFDAAGDLIVQDTDSNTFLGKLYKVPVNNGVTLTFGTPSLLVSGLQATAGLAIDPEGDFFLTGPGGLFEIPSGGPLSATSFDDNGNGFQYATAIAFAPSGGAFEPYAAGNKRLAFLADWGFAQQDNFITFITVDSPLVENSPAPEPASGWLLLTGSLLLVQCRGRSQKTQANRDQN